MIQIILLTGFLGAGKTTLLEHLLNYYKDSPIGLIVNEFGEINVDGHLLKRDGITMSELSNGSIFCACIKENYIKALIEMSSMNIDYLFIEASGLADPSSMQQILETIATQTIHRYHYSGSICVLDGSSFLEINTVLVSVQNQLAYAGAVIVNKEDLISPAIKAEIQEAIQAVNPNVSVYFTSYCNIDVDKLILHLEPPKIISKDSTNTPQSRPQSYILKLLPTITLDELRGFLNFIAPYTYRIKGFASIGDTNYSVSGVRFHMMILPWAGDILSSEIVPISSIGIGLISAIANGIKTYAPHSIKL